VQETKPVISQVTKALEAPSDLLLRVSTDLYFSHLFSSVPLFDQGELDSPHSSILQQHLLHFSGCLVKRTKNRREHGELEEIYAKMKAILYFNMEPNKLTILRTLCILGCWSPNAPDVVTLDSAWHWTGMGIRLALQMGIHRESSHSKSTMPDCRRRLWWCLLVS
jgi:hypothetical protein